MKKLIVPLLFTVLMLAACTSGQEQVEDISGLIVTVGDSQQTFSVEDLKALPAAEANFNDVAYKGVTVSALLEAVGVNPDEVKALKAVAADGYSVNYDTNQVLKDTVLVAYELADGSPLTADDGSLRMVLPDEEGKLNLRMLSELQVIQ